MKSSFLISSLDNLFLFVMILVGIKEAIISPSDDITEWDRRVLAFRADEASVDLGKKGGVAVLMRKAVSQLKETVASMSCLKSRHAPNLGKKDLKVFQGIELEGNSRAEKSALGQAQISTQG